MVDTDTYELKYLNQEEYDLLDLENYNIENYSTYDFTGSIDAFKGVNIKNFS